MLLTLDNKMHQQ